MNLESAVQKLKSLNVQVNQLETLLGKVYLTASPTHLEIDFLSECNLRCVMCHQSKMEIANTRLGQSHLEVLIDKLPHIETVMIAGLGEPLLYKGIDAFLPYLSRYSCKSHLFTNGELIDKRIGALRHLDKISVSFDGDNKHTFEKLRVRSNFAKIVSNIELLRSSCPEACIATSTIVSRSNVGEMRGIVRCASKLGIDEVHFSPVDHTPSLSLRPEDYAVFEEQIYLSRIFADSFGIKIFCNISRGHFKKKYNSKITSNDRNKAKSKRKMKGQPGPGSDPEPNRFVRSTGPSRIPVHLLSLEKEIAELHRRVGVLEKRKLELLNEVKDGSARLKIPGCTVPWKYTFARSTGNARLCPYADIDVGSIEEVFPRSYNSTLLSRIRRGFSQNRSELAVCENCTDDHREFRIDTLQKYMNSIEL